MASLYDTSATKALNEDAYINKLYDGTLESQKKALQQGYDNSVKQLTTGQDSTKKQTSDYVKRAYVEGQRAAGHVQKPTPSIPAPGLGNGGASAQARLTIGNQQQKNVSMLNNQQAVAEQEYERKRKLLAEKYEAQIKQAQADNDMNRAQALYDAAKAEEEQLRTLRQSAAALMATKDDNSIYDAIARGDSVERDTTSETWDSVLKNEESINKIYDAQLESERQAAEIAHKQSMSELDAKQQAAVRETDKNLTNAYVDALKKNKNYQEVQNAYGQGSGAAMQARLAREAGLTEKLTELRKLQQTKDAKNEMDKAEQVASLGDKLADSQKSIDKNRAKALYDAAEKEEQNLIADQQLVGNQYAKNGDYTMLARLYGLTPEQLGLLQNVGVGGGGGVTWSVSSGGNVYEQIKEAIKQGKPYSSVLKAIVANKNALTNQQTNELKNANTENGYREVLMATVRNPSGGNAENSAYWSSQKTQAYTQPSKVNTTSKKTSASSIDKGAHANSAYWGTR